MKQIIIILVILTSLISCSQHYEEAAEPLKTSCTEDTAFQAYKKSKQVPNRRQDYISTILILDTIFRYDQGIRNELIRREKVYGNQSREVMELIEPMKGIDSLNCIKVTKILDEHGWLGISDVGSEGNSTLFLVIQHSNLDVQEKYLPLMRTAVEQDKASGSELALLEDRVLLRQGKKQIYGSQLELDFTTGKYIISPIQDEPNVNKRRASVGLMPLEEYVKMWGIKYTVPNY